MPQFSLDGDTSGLPKTTATNLPYEIERIPQGPIEQWHEDANQVTALVVARWEDKAQFVQDMVGKMYVGGNKLRRTLPEANPDPDATNQFCMMMDLTDQWADPNIPVYDGVEEDESGDITGGTITLMPPCDAVSGWPVYVRVKYRAVFQAVNWSMVSDSFVDSNTGGELNRYVTRKYTSQAKELTIPGGKLFPPSGPPIMQAAFIVVPFGQLTMTAIRIPWAIVPRNTLRACEGKVNSMVFDNAVNDGRSWPNETILFVGADFDSKKRYDQNGDLVTDIQYSFRVNLNGNATNGNQGWNTFANGNGTFVRVTTAANGAGNTPYRSTDLNQLFVFTVGN